MANGDPKHNLSEYNSHWSNSQATRNCWNIRRWVNSRVWRLRVLPKDVKFDRCPNVDHFDLYTQQAKGTLSLKWTITMTRHDHTGHDQCWRSSFDAVPPTNKLTSSLSKIITTTGITGKDGKPVTGRTDHWQHANLYFTKMVDKTKSSLMVIATIFDKDVSSK